MGPRPRLGQAALQRERLLPPKRRFVRQRPK
ncbi:hypothetical protein chiPu_0027134, partial [Chiloscyllium punctatum]|nr:hypothetical protein [Chiloscyllium punctatum]